MSNKFLVVKVKNDQKQIIGFLRDSYKNKKMHYYNVNQGEDKETISTQFNDCNCKVVFILFYKQNNLEYKAEEIFIGIGKMGKDKNINYIIEDFTDAPLVIENFIKSSELDLKNDFNNNSYLSIETSIELMKKLEIDTKNVYKFQSISYDKQKYEKLSIENGLSEFSQKNEDCKRAFGTIKVDENRSEFQRDRERIVHSKASRRLVDKAQIFTSSKGDHYRTRMTHTLEVSQIARGIALRLNLNSDLTEGIALAHDIGHTPFGHQGERTLNNILRNKVKIINNADIIDFGGFKHNFQGVRVLSYLEEKYLNNEGLDLSYQVLEGVLKHTGGRNRKCNDCNDFKKDTCSGKCFDISEFLINGEDKYLFLDYDFPTTLEGQIVSIADEIAQRGHDLDDAFASNHLCFDELLTYSELKKMKSLNDILETLWSEFNIMKKTNRMIADENDMLRSLLVPRILEFFMNNVVNQSLININSYNENEFYKEYHRFDEKLINFSVEGKFILVYLEKIISKKVINSFEVARFDDKSKMIITLLFKAYYNNPRLLHDGTLIKVHKDMKKISNNTINFRSADPDLISNELELICFENLLIDDEGKIDPNNEYLKKRKALVRGITDYIASMTDNYAMNEYNLIYGN